MRNAISPGNSNSTAKPGNTNDIIGQLNQPTSPVLCHCKGLYADLRKRMTSLSNRQCRQCRSFQEGLRFISHYDWSIILLNYHHQQLLPIIECDNFDNYWLEESDGHCDGQEHYIVVHIVQASDGQGRNGSSIPQLRPITTLRLGMTTYYYLIIIITIILTIVILLFPD